MFHSLGFLGTQTTTTTASNVSADGSTVVGLA